jgi:polyribonucleotide nucleotidyltransferase
MFNNVPFRHSLEFFGQKITLETGLLAQQATATVLATQGETTVLAAVVIGKPTTMDFLPLQVIYEEKLYAAGKIKGSRFIKREGRPTDNAVLTGRLVDRSIRSLFNDSIRNDIQVIITVLSVDEINPPDTLAVLAASAALTKAGVEGFTGPVSCVRVGLSPQKDHLIVNPTYTQLKESHLDLVVSGTGSNIMMLEAGANIVEEEYLTHAMEAAMPGLAQLSQFQQEFIQLSGGASFTPTSKVQGNQVVQELAKAIEHNLEEAMYSQLPKLQKYAAIDEVIKTQVEALKSQFGTEAEPMIPLLKEEIHKVQKVILERNILDNNRRLDGRQMNEVRQLDSQIDVIPRVHGSSMFQRGETQVLNILTLGTLRDSQTMDDMEDFEETTKRYMHHYNFPQYSVGETGRYTGPSRRDIGHGSLAEKALVPVLPSETDFPYAIRVVSECLGSNGSTSMASTCASTLSLMAAGVPIKDMVAGIAMGVVVGKDGRHKLLTDIQGAEDHLGDMDFKVTGTANGVTAIQLDNKISGLTVAILTEALAQSKAARLHILETMKQAISKPRSHISEHAPKVTTIAIPLERVGDVIGPQGKIIKSIIAATGVEIDIEDTTGMTMIYAKDAAQATKALDMIKALIKVYAPGDVVQGTIFRIEDYGAFAKFDGEHEGMIHVSRMSTERTEKVTDRVKLGDIVTAYVAEINDKGQVALSLVPLDQLPAREARPPRPHGDRPHRPNRY